MKKVCKAINDYEQWRYLRNPTNWSPFHKNLPPLNSPDSIKTRICTECFRIISPDIILASHRCLPVAFEDFIYYYGGEEEEEEEEEKEESLCFYDYEELSY